MQNSQIRHTRINHLYKFALRGATEKQIIIKAMAMGVTKETAKGYFYSVRAMLMELKRNQRQLK